MQGEQRIGVVGTEVAAFVGVSRLKQNRMSLWPRGQRRNSAHFELRAVMVDHCHPVGIEISSRIDIGQHGIRCQAIPEFACDAEELLGPLVTVSTIEETTAPEVRTGERVRRGDNVPTRAAVRQLVERRELPCYLERLVERGVDRSGQPQPVGDGGQRRQHGERVRPAHHVEVVDLTAMLTQSPSLGEEEEVEEAAFGGAGHVRERVELDLAARFRIGPHRGAVDAREMGGEMNGLAALAFPCTHLPIPQRCASSSCERTRAWWSWVTDVMTSSSAPLRRCRADSRSATSSASPTNWVSNRSLTTGSCSSVSCRQSPGAG